MVNGYQKIVQILKEFVNTYETDQISKPVLEKMINRKVGIDDRTVKRYFKVTADLGLVEWTQDEENGTIKLPK